MKSNAVRSIALIAIFAGLFAYSQIGSRNGPRATAGRISAPPIAAVVAATELAVAERDHKNIQQDPRAAKIAFVGVAQARWVAPNARGEYARVLTAPSAVATVEVPFPEARPGEGIVVQAEDGGRFEAGVESGHALISADRHARFQFKVSAFDGLQRVTLRRGGESRVIEFWVSPEPPVLVRR